MATLILRSLIIFFLLLFVFRRMGKRQLGQMQPFELVLTLVIADLATIPMAEISIPMLNGIVPLLTLIVLHFVITILSKKFNGFSKIVSGSPVIVINPKGIDFMALQALNISVDDLFESLRASGYWHLDQVQYAIMETNGTLNVMPKARYATVSCENMGIKVKDEVLPVAIITEGSFNKTNAQILNITMKDTQELLEKQKIKNIKDVLVLSVAKNGQCYLQLRKQPYIVFDSSILEGKNEKTA